MPLRDHFRPPVSKRSSWEGFHAMWPTTIIQNMGKLLPPGFTAEPRVHLGALFEIDVNTYESDDASPAPAEVAGDGGTATATLPITTVEIELPNEYEYEVLVYVERERTLIAAIELVSPGNKNRAAKRNAFVGECAALLRKGVAVSVIDLVTVRQFNLFAELMTFIGHTGLAPASGSPVYAGACRWAERGGKNYLDVWSQPLAVGQPLPTIPLWLGPNQMLLIDLEPSYEQACRDLRIA
ncbi:MAG: DUF4058 family protein [Gemmataceae bacterium]|nr:DUF4058 family protein [Gemmataceae bacterium]